MSYRRGSLGGLKIDRTADEVKPPPFRKRRRACSVRPHPVVPGVVLVDLGKGREALCDEAMCPMVKAFVWYLDKGGYAAGRPLGKLTTLHRFLWWLWEDEQPEQVDHINGDRLDCRRSNLRAATLAQNMCNRRMPRSNRSGVKGVRWNPKSSKWRARIYKDRRAIDLGQHDTIEAAQAAYIIAARALHGEFARLS